MPVPSIESVNSTSASNIGDLLQEGDFQKGIKIIAFVFLMLLSMLGNALLIAVVYKNANQRMRTPSNYFIFNMACADVLLTVYTIQIRRTHHKHTRVARCGVLGTVQGTNNSIKKFFPDDNMHIFQFLLFTHVRDITCFTKHSPCSEALVRSEIYASERTIFDHLLTPAVTRTGFCFPSEFELLGRFLTVFETA